MRRDHRPGPEAGRADSPRRVPRGGALEPLGLSAYALAKAIGVPRNRITGIVRGERTITADTALRLGRFFAMSPEFWLGLQMDCDLEVARHSIGSRIEREVAPRAA